MNFIPLTYYINIYYFLILFTVFFSFVNTIGNYNKKRNRLSAFFLFIFLISIIGLRPISFTFGDMGNYARYFNDMKTFGFITNTGDIGFYSLMKLLSTFVQDKTFFFVLALLYIYPLFYASKRLFPDNYYFSFLFLVASFSFFSYGTNGLRNGIATSFFILGLSYTNNKFFRWIWFVLAWSFHSSLMLPIIAYLLSIIINKPKYNLSLWFVSVALSITSGNYWEGLFLKLGLNFSNSVGDYFDNKDLYQDSFSSIGFRWDFLLYSTLPIIIGFYFIFVKKINDTNYNRLFNIYLLANSVWILVIRASFTNRFAYLSWFLMGLVIVYPFLKQVYWKNQYLRLWILLVFYFSFTFFMNIFVYNY